MFQNTNKQIHYCWFGNSSLSETAETSIASWKRYVPGFEIVRWDESNFNINACTFSHKAYEAKKWAFVSDYARFKILFEYGGIYMDVGSELVKNITPLLQYTPFSAIEESLKTVASGLILCANKADPIIKKVIDTYEATDFVDDPEWLREHTVNQFFTKVLETQGYERKDMLQEVENWTIFPSSYFNPIYGRGGYHITENTYAVHQSSGSWIEPKFKIKQQYVSKLSPIIGRRLAQIFGRTIAEYRTEGFLKGTKELYQVTRDCLRRHK